MRSALPIATLLIVSACAAVPQAAPPVAVAPPAIRTTGLERVMGQTASQLVGLFGSADQDVREANARKLQFGSGICVLDAYLYPPANGREPVVTHVDARQTDGSAIDRASCVAALVRRREAR